MNTLADDPSQPSDSTLDADADFIAIQLRRAREEANLSVIELSRLTGLSKTVLHGYERGRTKPGAREIRLLSNALRTSPNWLIFGSDEFDKGKSRFSSIYRKLKAKPGVAVMLATFYVPMVTALLDEAEMESLMTIVEALIRAKHSETADKMAVIAQEVGIALDEALMPNGDLSPEVMQEALKRAQERVQEKLQQPKT